MANSAPIISIIGKSNSGKTTLLEKVIAELKRRNYRVGTVKHHSHRGFEIDKPGKDSWRHAQAGSDHVVLVAPDKLASIKLLQEEISLDEIAATMQDVDVILTEGFKHAGKPTIEILRAERSRELLCSPDTLLAVVTNFELETAVPHYNWNDIDGITGLIEHFIKEQSNQNHHR